MPKIEFQFAGLTKEVKDAAQRPAKLRRLLWTRLRIVSFNAERYIKIRMPVDTGRARASWGHASAPAEPGDGVWVENEEELSIEQGSNLEYIGALNEGSSQQAPAGFIDAEIERAINDFIRGLDNDLEALA